MATRSNKYKSKNKAKHNPTDVDESTEEKPNTIPGSHNKDETIIQMAMDLFEDSQDGSNYNRIEAEEDIRFSRLSEQWPKDIKQSREEQSRPCLTINRLPALIRQVVNSARQNKPGIVVSPVDNGADVDTAEVYTGLVRSIERNSNATVAYDTAIDNACSCGFGFFQLSIEYANHHSFDKEIRIVPITNPLSVHWDVTDTGLDAKDWRYCFISELLNQKKFEKEYPDAMKVSFEGDINQRESWWLADDGVRVSDFWLRENEKKTLYMIRDNSAPQLPPAIIMQDEFEKNEDALQLVENGIWTIAREREVDIPKVVRRTITGAEVLDTLEWPGPTIPVCPVWGEVVVLDGRRYLRSMIRDAKDSQIMFNYWRTTATELVALQPKAPWLVKVGSIPEGHQHKWEQANVKNFSYLEYEGDVPPQRQGFAGAPAGAITEAMNASDDMKAITGIHDASVGAQGNETSGKAISLRQSRGDNANFHFVDNLNRAIQYAGQCIVDAIPSVYSEHQTLRILGDDMKEKVVKVANDFTRQMAELNGDNEKMYDISIGKYDVSVKSGPGYLSQREETREVFIEMMRAMPQVAPFISDFLMDHMDFQGAEKLSKRLKLILPPEIQKMEMAQDIEGMPAEIQDRMKQAQMLIQKLEGELKQALSDQAPEMKKLEVEQTKAMKEAEIDMAKAATEAKKFDVEMQKLADDTKLKQEANDLNARKLDLEQMKIKQEEEKIRLMEREVEIKEYLANKEPPPEPKEERKEEKDDKGPQTAIMAGLLSLAKGQMAPIEIKRGKDGKISGAKRISVEDADKIN